MTETKALPSYMQAIVREADGPKLRTIPLPLPGGYELLIQVRAAGICRTDLLAACGALPVPIGRVLGHEFAGVVAARGGNVDAFKVGSPVTAFPFLCDMNEVGEAHMLGIGHDGAFAEYVRVPASHCFPVADQLSFEAAAYAEPVCAVLGVLSTGIKAAQAGCIIGHNRFSALTAETLRAIGFLNISVLSPSELSALPNAFDFIIETALSQELLNSALLALRRHGRLILKSRRAVQFQLPSKIIVERELQVCGAFYGSFTQAIELIASGALNLEPLVGRTAPLSQFQAVFDLAGHDEGQKLFLTGEV